MVSLRRTRKSSPSRHRVARDFRRWSHLHHQAARRRQVPRRAEFNAEAVKKSIERQLEPNRTDDMAYASFVFGSESTGTGVASVEKTGDYEVILHMRAASTPFKMNLAMLLRCPHREPYRPR